MKTIFNLSMFWEIVRNQPLWSIFSMKNAFQNENTFRAHYRIASKQEAPCLLWPAAGTHFPACFLFMSVFKSYLLPDWAPVVSQKQISTTTPGIGELCWKIKPKNQPLGKGGQESFTPGNYKNHCSAAKRVLAVFTFSLKTLQGPKTAPAASVSVLSCPVPQTPMEGESLSLHTAILWVSAPES